MTDDKTPLDAFRAQLNLMDDRELRWFRRCARAVLGDAMARLQAIEDETARRKANFDKRIEGDDYSA